DSTVYLYAAQEHEVRIYYKRGRWQQVHVLSQTCFPKRGPTLSYELNSCAYAFVREGPPETCPVFRSGLLPPARSHRSNLTQRVPCWKARACSFHHHARYSSAGNSGTHHLPG